MERRMVNTCATGLLVLLMCGSSMAATMEAEVSMNDVRATITFSDDVGNGTITTEFTAGWQAGMAWGIHVLPFVYTTDVDVCANENVGDGFLPLTNILGSPLESGVVEFPTANLFSVLGTRGVAGRSIVVSDGTTRSCANIQKPRGSRVRMAAATLANGAAGTVEFREFALTHTTVVIDLALTSPGPSEKYLVALYEHNSMRCSYGAPLTILGEITVGHRREQRDLLIESRLPFSLISSSSVVLLRGGEVALCREVRLIDPKSVSSLVSMNGLSGHFVFSQNSPYEATQVTFTLQNPSGPPLFGYHVHEFPRPYRFTSEDDLCSNPSVSGHYNPLGAIVPTPEGFITDDRFEIGDLSGKYGSLGGQEVVVREGIRDWNLPLFGRFSIVGRSIVFHLQDGGRFACSDIGYPGVTHVVTAQLVGPVIGQVVMTQEKSDPWGDTSIFVELGHTQNVATTTSRHILSINTGLVEGDAFVDGIGRCQSAGSIFNPFRVVTRGVIPNAYCKPSNPFACQAGNISGKLSTVSVGADAAPFSRAFYTDITTPLSGQYSVVGLSVVVGAANGGAYRLACANIELYPEPPAVVQTWAGRLITANPSLNLGSIRVAGSMRGASSSVYTALSQLGRRAGGYHIHEYPLAPAGSDAREAGVCSVESVGGHYNPFGIVGSPPTGTHDQYEIGDLSGKFGSLSGRDYVFATHMDINLPTRGVHSILGRSVVIHEDSDGSRYACGDLNPVLSPSVRQVVGTATFGGDVSGTVTFTNYLYPDGTTLDTLVTVDLYYTFNTSRITTGHNWHVHESTVTQGDCYSTGPHYNPFLAPITESRYSQLCSPSNPLYCELGDLSGKHGAYDIGVGRRTYTDVNLPLAGSPFSVIGRSLVFHVAGGGGARLACADILPSGAFSFIHTFPSPVVYSREKFLRRVAEANMNTHVIVTSPVPNETTSCCQEVTIYLPSSSYERQFQDFIQARDHLGEYSSYRCATEGSRTCLAANGRRLSVVPGTEGRYYTAVSDSDAVTVQKCPEYTAFNINQCLCVSLPDPRGFYRL